MKFSPLPVAALVLLASACGTDTHRPDPKSPFIQDTTASDEKRAKERDKELSAETLYTRARVSLDDGDFSTAIENYDKLTTLHPFSDYATQGELERIYAEYRARDPDKALTNADKFLREHPRHPAADYVQYLKGLVNFSRDQQSTSDILLVDTTKSEVTNQRRAFDDFSVLLQKYPNSPYAGDAYRRMIYVRTRLAEHELHVVDFYVSRGAYMAAAKRAEQIIALYPGTTASYRALEALAICYDKANLKLQADDARRLVAAQANPLETAGAPGSSSMWSWATGWFGHTTPTAAAAPAVPAPTATATAPSAAATDGGAAHFYADPADATTAEPPPVDLSTPDAEPADVDAAKKTPVPVTPPPVSEGLPGTKAAPVLTVPIKSP